MNLLDCCCSPGLWLPVAALAVCSEAYFSAVAKMGDHALRTLSSHSVGKCKSVSYYTDNVMLCLIVWWEYILDWIFRLAWLIVIFTMLTFPFQRWNTHVTHKLVSYAWSDPVRKETFLQTWLAEVENHGKVTPPIEWQALHYGWVASVSRTQFMTWTSISNNSQDLNDDISLIIMTIDFSFHTLKIVAKY